MKILHVIDSGGLYGAEMMLVSLASEQMKMGLKPVIGSIRRPHIQEKPVEHEARSRGIEVHEFSMRPGVNPAGAMRILRYVREKAFDIIHSHGYKTNILLGTLPGWLRRVPFVSTLHGWTSTGGWTKMRLNEELDAFSLRFVDRIVLVNRGMLDKPRIQTLPRNKIRIINNGIDIPCDNYHRDHKIDEYLLGNIRAFCSKGPVIASIGRLSREKGFAYLVEAVNILRDHYGENCRLMIIGDGRLRDELQEQAERIGLGENFLITGYIKNARSLLALVDIYVISSLTEGLPITLLETMASRTPVVATAVGGIPHVIRHEKEGLLVPPEDAQAIAGSVKELLNDESLRDSLVVHAFDRVNKEYSSRKMAEKYQKLYQEIASQK